MLPSASQASIHIYIYKPRSSEQYVTIPQKAPFPLALWHKCTLLNSTHLLTYKYIPSLLYAGVCLAIGSFIITYRIAASTRRRRQLRRLQGASSLTQGGPFGPFPPTVLVVDPEEGIVTTESSRYADQGGFSTGVEEGHPGVVPQIVVQPDGKTLGIAVEESSGTSENNDNNKK